MKIENIIAQYINKECNFKSIICLKFCLLAVKMSNELLEIVYIIICLRRAYLIIWLSFKLKYILNLYHLFLICFKLFDIYQIVLVDEELENNHL